MRSPSAGTVLAALGLCWLVGVGLQLQQAALWPAGRYGLPLAVGLAALAIAAAGRRRAHAWAMTALATSGITLCAFAFAGVLAAQRLAQALPAALEGRDLVVTGVVVGLPQATDAGWRFRFEVEAAEPGHPTAGVPRLLSLGWYRGAHEDAAWIQPGVDLRAGQRWRFTVRLRQPHGNANPHGFDYELLLFEQGVRATGTVRDAPAPQLLDAGSGWSVDALRQRVRDAIARRVDDARIAGVLAALAVGDQAAIAREDWALFRDTGVAHLMSISGLHVTMFAWLAGLATAWLWRRSARAMLAVPAPLAARWGGVCAALAYAVFAGWGVPAQRTVLMLLVVSLLQSLGRRWPWPLVLLAAAVAVTIFDPWALLQPGFWLSFMAVGLLMSSAGAQPQALPRVAQGVPAARSLLARGWQHLRGGVRTQVVATVGLAPLTLVFFQQVSVVGLAANLIAIPLVTLLITPLALVGTLLPTLWQVAAWVTGEMVAGLAWFAQLPFAVWSVPVAPRWAQWAALLAGLLAVLPLPWRLRLLAIPLALPLLVPPQPAPDDGGFSIIAADVGQGSAVLVRTRGHLLVYDAGPQYTVDSDAGQRVLLPLLRALGERRIDLLMLSHRDTDHVGGAASLLAALPVTRLSSSLASGHPLISARAPAGVRCEAGQRWEWDGVAFEVMWPPSDAYGPPSRPNALSCVLRVQGRHGSLLLTGDIEARQELALVAGRGDALASDVLVVPHHGSRSSSSAELLAAVRPRVAVVQAGYRNRYGHPAPEVLERYAARGIAVRATPDCGAWRMEVDLAPQEGCWRDTARRYWHHSGAQPP